MAVMPPAPIVKVKAPEMVVAVEFVVNVTPWTLKPAPVKAGCVDTLSKTIKSVAVGPVTEALGVQAPAVFILVVLLFQTNGAANVAVTVFPTWASVTPIPVVLDARVGSVMGLEPEKMV